MGEGDAFLFCVLHISKEAAAETQRLRTGTGREKVERSKVACPVRVTYTVVLCPTLSSGFLDLKGIL